MDSILYVLFTLGTVHAATVDTLLPIETAHSVDQKQVTSQMLLSEVQQYKSIADWHRYQHELEIAKARLVRAKSEFERAEKLSKTKAVTDKHLAHAFSDYEALLIEASRLEYEVLLAKGIAELHRLRVIEEGNPESDYRKEIASTLANGLRIEVASLKSRLQIANTIQNIAKTQLETGRALHREHAIATAELEKREVTYKEAMHTADSVAKLIKLSERAAEAFEDNLRRL